LKSVFIQSADILLLNHLLPEEVYMAEEHMEEGLATRENVEG
jgi:hypothetical protein